MHKPTIFEMKVYLGIAQCMFFVSSIKAQFASPKKDLGELIKELQIQWPMVDNNSKLELHAKLIRKLAYDHKVGLVHRYEVFKRIES